MRKRIRKKHRKKTSQKSILVSQNLQKSLQNHEKSRKIAPQRDAERSLFRDAMELARKSSEVNGAQRLESV